MFVHNSQCQPFNNGGFTHTRFSYQNRIILFSSAQNLRYTLYLLFSTYNGVQMSINSHTSYISSKSIQNRCFGFCIGFLLDGRCLTAHHIFPRIIFLKHRFGRIVQGCLKMVSKQFLIYVKIAQRMRHHIIF